MIYDFWKRAESGARWALDHFLLNVNYDRQSQTDVSTNKESFMPQNTNTEATPTYGAQQQEDIGSLAKPAFAGSSKPLDASDVHALSKTTDAASTATKASVLDLLNATERGLASLPSKVMKATRAHIAAGIGEADLAAVENARPYVI